MLAPLERERPGAVVSLAIHPFHGFTHESLDCHYLGDCWKLKAHPVHQGEPIYDEDED